MRIRLLAQLLLLFSVSLWACGPAPAAPHADDQGLNSVVLIVLDGVRPAEFFRGISPFAKNRRASQSSKKLMPYLRGELSQPGYLQSGQTLLFGNRFAKGAPACRLDNNYGVSLPAYGHLLSGKRLPGIRDNRFPGPLPGPSVPDRLVARGIAGEAIAVYASWGPIARVATERSPREDAQIEINTGHQPGNARPRWKDARFDRDLQRALLQRLDPTRAGAQPAPRYLFAAFNDSDEWAHIGSYRRYIAAIRAQDGYIRSIVRAREAVATPANRGRTLYIVTTDHGRGRGRWWKSHGRVPGSQYIWALLHVPSVELPVPPQTGKPATPGQTRQMLRPEVRADLEHVRRTLEARCNHSQLGRVAYQAVSGDRTAEFD